MFPELEYTVLSLAGVGAIGVILHAVTGINIFPFVGMIILILVAGIFVKFGIEVLLEKRQVKKELSDSKTTVE